MNHKLRALQDQMDQLHGNYIEILPLAEEMRDVAQLVHGKHSVEYAVALNELGGVFRHLSRYPEAEKAFKEAMAILSETIGNNDPNYATAVNNLAGLYRLMKAYVEAEALFNHVIAIYQEQLGYDHFLTLSAINNLGLVYQDLGRYEEAQRLHEKCLALLEPQKREHPIAYATTLNNLSHLYEKKDDLTKAAEIMHTVIQQYKALVGETHPLYANALNNYASLLYKQGHLERAQSLFKESQQLNLKLYGKESDYYKIATKNINVIQTALEKAPMTAINSQISAHQSPQNTPNNDEPHTVERVLAHLLDYLAQKPNANPSSTLEVHKGPYGYGLTLCHRYFTELCFPVLQQVFPEEIKRMAIGVVGEGSECFGFDDLLSQDHDFGPRIMVWLTKEDYALFGEKVAAALALLPKEFEGVSYHASFWGKTRESVSSIEGFYARFTQLSRPPQTAKEWQNIPEAYLATATNGAVFYDPLGIFIHFRTELLNFYPEDIRLKKIAARCMLIAQAGQYNFRRSWQRQELVALNACGAQFIEAGISLIFLLNRRYKPFYKWMHRALNELPILGAFSYQLFNEFVETSMEKRVILIEQFCKTIIKELQRQQLTTSQSDFLLDHGPEVLLHIRDESLRQSNPWVE